MPNDMASVIAPKSDQINADDLIAGEMTITITGVKIAAGEDQPVSIQFAGSPKVFRPCKSMSRVLVAVWGPDTSKYVGRALKLYRDGDVTWGGLKVGGIRIREMSDMPNGKAITLALTEKRGSRRPSIIKPLVVEQQAPKPEAPEMAAAARAAARLGTDRFRAWWNTDEGKIARPATEPIMAELKVLCSAADEAIEADPFGLPPLPGFTPIENPTPEQIAAAERAVMAAIAAQNGEEA